MWKIVEYIQQHYWKLFDESELCKALKALKTTPLLVLMTALWV